MYGQQNYNPQFRQGTPVNPPPQFQQGPPPPPFLQGPPPPPPPLNHEGYSAAPRHPTYQHGLPPPPPPLQQGGPPQPSQHYLHPSPGYINSSMIQSSTNPQQNGHFPSPLPPRVMHPAPNNQEAFRVPFLPRVFPPPPSQGQMLYVTPRPPPPSIGQGIQHGQLLPPPPPPPSSFVSIIPAPFVSPQAPPSMPPPPPPPPPSSPPPLPPPPPSAPSPPPLPPPSPSASSPLHLPPPPPFAPSPDIATTSSLTSSFVPLGDSSHSSQQLFSGSGTNRISDNLESGLDYVDKGASPAHTTDNLLASGDHPTNDAGHQGDMAMVEVQPLSETQPASSPPPKPSENETVRQIEILCQYIVKNGSDFEDTVRGKENGNPKFAFLFGGEPGSEAAIAHDYFQWMKRKCLMEFKLHNGSGSQHTCSPLRLSGVESSSRHINDDACQSLADSDMDMEDDTHQFDKAQTVDGKVHDSKESDLLYKEVCNVKEHPIGNKCSKDDRLADNKPSNIDLSRDIPELAKTETEYDQIPSMSSAGASECYLEATSQKSTRPVEDFTSTKTSSAAASGNNHEAQDTVGEIGSPFRLIQNYASDESGESDDGESFEAVSPEKVFPTTRVFNVSLNEQKGAKMEVNTTSVSTPVPELGLPSLTESNFLCPVDLSSKIENIHTKSPKVVKATVVAFDTSDVFVKSNEFHEDNHDGETADCLGNEDSLRRTGDVDSQSGKFHKGGEKQGSVALKVDEFGRIIREGVSDSDSDVERHSERRYRRDRSRSPLDRSRRRSRSPRRRNEKRNRSRSWSPRKRRSTSNSRSPPAFRHTGEFSGGKMRRDREQIQECFDFLKGRCYRGASCRYLHHESGVGDTSRHSKGRQLQHVEAPKDSRKSITRGESHSVETCDANIVPPRNQHDSLAGDGVRIEVPCSDMAVSDIVVSTEGLCIDMAVSSIDVPKDGDLNEKTETDLSVDDPQPFTYTEVDQSTAGFTTKVDHSDSQEATEQEFENQTAQQVVETTTAVQVEEFSKMPNEDETREIDASVPSTEPSLTATVVNQQLQAMFPHSKVAETDASAPLAEQPISAEIVTNLPHPPESSAHEHLTPRDFHPPHFPAENYKFQHSQLPPPPPITSANVSVSEDRYAAYQASLNDQYSQSLAPPKPTWTPLPPPPPYVQGSTSTAPSHSQGFHPHFQQNPTSLMRPYQHGLPTHSQAIDVRPPTGELHRPSFHPEGVQKQPFDFHKVLGDQHFQRSSVFDGNRFHPGPLQGPSMHLPHQLREEQHFPVQLNDGIRNFQTLPNQRFTGFMSQDMHTQAPFLNEGVVNQVRPFPDGNSNHSSSSKEFGASTTIHSLTQQHQPTYGTHWSGTTSFPHLSSENAGLSTRRYPLSFDGESKLSHLPVTGGSRISAHYNPFASTFDNMPGSSKYTSNFKQDSLTNPISRYDSLSLNTMSPLDSNRSKGQILPKSGDPYDPLFDSIEPSSKTLRNFEHVSGGNLTRDAINRPVTVQPTTESQTVTKFDYLHGSGKLEEKEEIVGGNAGIVTSPENDEFGETAIDAEMGAVESESPDNDIAEKGTGDVEIDQVKSKGKNKKSKDSRSLKLFKVALADFVKDVLKPSWRQGNLSKEVFKTIVKKTVEKVAGAMKNHQIPKGQAKINQYIESSQRKLTKLVMGYVDKYVKA